MIRILAIALVLSLGGNTFLGWRLLDAHETIGARETTIKLRDQALKGAQERIDSYEASANRDYAAIQKACLAGRDAALKAGRTIGRITNAPAPDAGGRRVVGPDELRDIYGQTRGD